MKLIAETTYENQIVHGLCSLLRDLKVDVDGYLHEQAIATTFWSADDFIVHLESIQNASQIDQRAFLLSIEDKIRAAMEIAGANVIQHELLQANQKTYKAVSMK